MKRVILILALGIFVAIAGWQQARAEPLPVEPPAPAKLVNLIFRWSPSLMTPSSSGADLRVTSGLTIDLHETMAPDDEIRLATVLVLPGDKWRVPIDTEIRTDGLDCKVEGRDVVCRVADEKGAEVASGDKPTTVEVVYEALVSYCPVEGLLLQTAIYKIDGRAGDLMAGWAQQGQLSCAPMQPPNH